MYTIIWNSIGNRGIPWDIYVVLPDAAVGLIGTVEDLKTAVKVLQDRLEDGNFTVDVGGVVWCL